MEAHLTADRDHRDPSPRPSPGAGEEEARRALEAALAARPSLFEDPEVLEVIALEMLRASNGLLPRHLVAAGTGAAVAEVASR